MKEGERESRERIACLCLCLVLLYIRREVVDKNPYPLPFLFFFFLHAIHRPFLFYLFIFFFEKAVDLFPNRHSSLSCVGTQAMTTCCDHIKCSQALIVKCIPIKLAISNHRLSIGEKIKAIIVYKLMQSPTFSMHIIDLERTRLQS